MPSASDQTLENQNEEELNSLHSKIRSLRSVTIDILDDANRQNDQLDRTTNSFTSFASSLFSTSRHHSRTMASTSTLRQYRTIAYIVGAIVFLWLVAKIWRFGSGGGGPPVEPPIHGGIEPEYK
ncbi:hypothetical protein I316_00482 [Kwoniella heveanensis BCC8398]|uniref:t-SNARE coiled-coil homology domain-containing protein n=1 Tax=Kwoniella heveanensis BCC8398 TaxID=1296120 RepID=A0A1B9H267_9TREE|nr:hypothetical protein I316_00482 [Kwoniella heveanensis BCC8398]